MFTKMQDYMQECIVTELDFLDDTGDFDVTKYKEFISMVKNYIVLPNTHIVLN